jgi:hypothetical protein
MVDIDTKLIIKLNFPSYEELTYEEKMHRLMELDTMRLSWADITRIDGLELYGHLKSLHMQFNCIQVIENLEFLTELEYLNLAGNAIRRVSGLRTLNKLISLNLSANQIDRFELAEIPPQVALLEVKDNPASSPELRRQILVRFEMLEVLDECEVTEADRLEALGFRTRREVVAESDEPVPVSDRREIKSFMTEPEDYDELSAKTHEILTHAKSRVMELLERKEQYVKRLGQISRKK